MPLIAVAFLAADFAWAKTGNRIAARIAMIAITTRSSMSVKAFLDFKFFLHLAQPNLTAGVATHEIKNVRRQYRANILSDC